MTLSIAHLLITCLYTSFVVPSTIYTDEAKLDKVTSLPLADTKEFRSAQFSGYLMISKVKFIHYMYFESEDNPQTDPLVFTQQLIMYYTI